jgi:hypothetical protein
MAFESHDTPNWITADYDRNEVDAVRGEVVLNLLHGSGAELGFVSLKDNEQFLLDTLSHNFLVLGVGDACNSEYACNRFDARIILGRRLPLGCASGSCSEILLGIRQSVHPMFVDKVGAEKSFRTRQTVEFPVYHVDRFRVPRPALFTVMLALRSP